MGEVTQQDLDNAWQKNIKKQEMLAIQKIINESNKNKEKARILEAQKTKYFTGGTNVILYGELPLDVKEKIDPEMLLREICDFGYKHGFIFGKTTDVKITCGIEAYERFSKALKQLGNIRLELTNMYQTTPNRFEVVKLTK